jgi:hypothetical protein
MHARVRRFVGFGMMVGLVASLMFASAVSADRDDANHNWGAILTGGSETSVGQWAQWGLVTFHVNSDGNSMDYTINMGMITDPKQAAIYLGGKGTNGPIIVNLWKEGRSGNVSGVMGGGTITAADLTGPMQGKSMNDLFTAIKAGNTYVNFTTVGAPDGAARGPIQSMEANHL